MKNKIIMLLLTSLLIFMSISKVEAGELSLENSNYCDYGTLKIIPYYKVGNDFQGDVNGSVAFSLTSGTTPNSIADQLKNDANYSLTRQIKMNSYGEVLTCPSICTANVSVQGYSRFIVHAKGVTNSDSIKVDSNSGCITSVKNDTWFNINFSPYKLTGEIINNRLTPVEEPKEPEEETDNKIKTYNCDTLLTADAEAIIEKIIGYIQFLVPVALILTVSFDMAKAVVAKDDKQIKVVTGRSVKRVVVAIVVFLIPLLVSVLFKLPGVREVFENYGIVSNPLCLGKGTNAPEKEKNDNKETTKTVGNERTGYVKVPKEWILKEEYVGGIEYNDQNDKQKKIKIESYNKAPGAPNAQKSAESMLNTLKVLKYDDPKMESTVIIERNAFKVTATKDGMKSIHYYIDAPGKLSENYVYSIWIEIDINDELKLEELVKSTFKIDY